MADAAAAGSAPAAAAPAAAPKLNAFLLRTPEDANHNQYWFAPDTISMLVQEVETHATRVAFISTPSVYFSLTKSSALGQSSRFFDLDRRWVSHANFTPYNFERPEDVPPELHHTFDFALIDPPFITTKCWECYATTIRLLLAPGGKVLASTVRENAPLLKQLLGLERQVFLPSVPSLVYQFSFFCNYDSPQLRHANPELPEQED